MGAEKLVAHQQPQALLKCEQAAWPAGCRCGDQLQAAALGHGQGLLVANHPQRWQIRQRRLLLLFSRRGWLPLRPEFLQQFGASVGGDQLQPWVGLSERAQQSHAVGVDVSHDHQQGMGFVWQQLRQCRKEDSAVGRSGGMHQNCGLVVPGGKQHTVGGAAAFQGIFQLEAMALWAQTAQSHHTSVLASASPTLPCSTTA